MDETETGNGMNQPGYKTQGPSQDAAESMRDSAPILRGRIIEALGKQSMTADGCAFVLGESILAVRPRFSELLRDGIIQDTGLRMANSSGRSATVWQLTGVLRQAELI